MQTTLKRKPTSKKSNGKHSKRFGADERSDRAVHLKEILDLRLQGKTLQEIGDIYGLKRQTICQKIQGIFAAIDKQRIEAYDDFKIPMLKAAKTVILDNMFAPKVIKKASFNNLAYGFTQLSHDLRLEQGQSTQNIDFHATIRSIKEDEAKVKELDAQLAGVI